MDKRGCLAATSQREGEVKGQALVVLEVSLRLALEQQVAMAMEGGVAMETEGGVAVGQQIEIQQPQTQPQVATLGVWERGRWGVVYDNLLIFISSPSGHPTLQTPVAIPTEAFTTSKQLH